MSESLLTLPHGWELEDGTTDVAGPQAQAVEAYGGATMNWALDGALIWHLGCCAKKDGGSLYFSIFRIENSALVNVPISGAGTGRGWLDVADDGIMYWSSWEGSSIRPAGPPARVPGAVQVQTGGDTSALEAEIVQLTARVDALTAQLAGSPPIITNGVLYLSGQPGMPVEGGEIQLVDGKGGIWAIDCRDGNLRFIHDGAVYKRWPE
jgi:hypothetical protein